MERLILIGFGFLIMACNNKAGNNPSIPQKVNPEVISAQLGDSLKEKGYQVFQYVDQASGDTLLMQQYFMAFLKTGPERNQSKEEADSLQQLHLGHMQRMYDEGYSSIAGPFQHDGELRGIVIYNTPTLRMADSLARLDPMIQAGRLDVEVLPWWAAKGFHLR